MYAQTYDPAILAEVIDLVRPVGYKILIAMPQVLEKTKGGVFMPGDLQGREHTASIVGYVVDLGPEAFSDEKRFPNGPWCKKGDVVLFRSYSGTRFKYRDQEFRHINDDTIEAVVSDPSKIERA